MSANEPKRARTTQAIEKGGTREDEHGGVSGSGNGTTAVAVTAGMAAAGQGREQEQEQLQQGKSGSGSISSCRGGTCSRSRGTMCSPPPFFLFPLI